MVTKLALYTLVTSLSTSVLITGAHYASHAYIEAETKVKTAFEEKATQFKASILAYNGLREPTPMVTPHQRADIIAREAGRHSLNPSLIQALIEIESNGRKDAERFEPTLNTRSIGLTQVLATWAGHAPCTGINWTDLYQEEPNIKCGTAILALSMHSKKNLFEALIAFNGGDSCSSRPACREKASAYAGKVIMRFAELVKGP